MNVFQLHDNSKPKRKEIEVTEPKEFELISERRRLMHEMELAVKIKKKEEEEHRMRLFKA